MDQTLKNGLHVSLHRGHSLRESGFGGDQLDHLGVCLHGPQHCRVNDRALEGVANTSLHGSLSGLAGDFAEGRIGVGGVRCRPVGVIGEVEGIEAEGQELILEGLETLLQTCVVLRRTGTEENITIALRGEGSRGRGGEDASVAKRLRLWKGMRYTELMASTWRTS